MIKDVKTVLEKTGNFSKITMGRKENGIPLYDGKAVIPDIIAYINNIPAYRSNSYISVTVKSANVRLTFNAMLQLYIHIEY